MVYGKGGEMYTRRAVVIAEYLQGLVEQINAISKRLRYSFKLCYKYCIEQTSLKVLNVEYEMEECMGEIVIVLLKGHSVFLL